MSTDPNMTGSPLLPAQNVITGKSIPSITLPTLCGVGGTIPLDFLNDIDAAFQHALGAIKNNLPSFPNLRLNPIAHDISVCLDKINANITKITSKLLGTISDSLKTALTAAQTLLNTALTHINNLMLQAEKIIGDGLNDILKSISLYQPSNLLPSVKKYGVSDLTSSLTQGTNIQSLSSSVDGISTTLDSLSMSDDEIAAAITPHFSNISSMSTAFETAVTSDTQNLTDALNQNDALNTIGTMAHHMNNPDIAGLMNQITDPQSSGAINALAAAMKV